MAVENGIILELADDVNTLIARYPTFEVFDLEGRTVLPGLIDAHVHMIGEGIVLLRAQLMYSESVAEVIERLQT